MTTGTRVQRTFGTATLKDGAWHLEVEPHVAIKLKRVFSRIGKQYGVIVIQDSDEVSRDLSWFCQRYPLEFDDASWAHLWDAADEFDKRTEDFAYVLAGSIQPRAFELTIPLREYQKIGAELALRSPGLLVADDVGLGKSALAIGTLTDPSTRPALIVTLTHLPTQWQREIEKFAPGTTTHVLTKGQPYDLTPIDKKTGVPRPFPDVIITNYHKLSGWAETLAGHVKTIIFDECVTGDTQVQRWPPGSGTSTVTELLPGDSVVAFTDSGDLVPDTVIGVTAKGQRPTWRLLLNDGRHLDCSDNERILTEAGWVYVRELIDEASARHTGKPTDSVRGSDAATGARLPSWRRPSGHQADASEDQANTWPKAEAVPGIQGADALELHPDTAQGDPQQWLREIQHCSVHGHDTRFRVLALDLHPTRAQDRHAGVAVHADVGGRSVLVHGRRAYHHEIFDFRNQHARVFATGSDLAGAVASGSRRRSNDRFIADAIGQTVLWTSVPPHRDFRTDRDDPPVRAAVYGVQNRTLSSVSKPAVHWLQQNAPRFQTPPNSSGNMLWLPGVPTNKTQNMALTPHHVVDIEYLGHRPLYDVETHQHHTLVAGGFAVHNCQELRRSSSQKAFAARHLAEKATRRLGLSATPVYNYGGEMFNVFQVLRPGQLGTWTEFSQEWVGAYADQDKARIKDPKALGTYLREQGMMIRRTRAEVGRELPPLIKIHHHVESDPEALEKISKDVAELARLVLQAGVASADRWEAAGELDWRLRQATGISKAAYVADFVRMLHQGGGGKILLYAWHRSVYDILLDKLKDLKPAMYTGSESPNQKLAAFERFTKGDAQVLLMSLRAGAGLDGLQGSCNNVVFGELDWSPGVHEQCLSADTEILTPDGFRGPDGIEVGDLVAAFELDGTIRWVPALAKTDRSLGPSEAMYACRTEKFDLRVTGQHRMVVRRKRRTTRGIARSSWEIALAADLDGSSRRFVPVSGLQHAPGVALTDYELRLLGWYVTDGYFDGSELHLYQAASQPWNADIVEVLKGCGLGWSLFQRHSPSGTLMNIYSVSSGLHPRWSASDVAGLRTLRATGKSRADVARALGRSRTAVYKKERAMSAGRKAETTSAQGRGWSGLEVYFDKNLSPLLEAMTREQLRSFLLGVHMGDGAKRAKNVYRITSTNIIFLDRLQSLCVRRGFSANISTRKTRTRAGRLAYDIWIADACEASLARSEKPGGFGRAKASAGERVWCVTNVLGTLVVRRKGKVAVVGNCAGRVHRDGQPDSVAAYYLVSDSGSDPVIADVLGLKRQQSEGLIDPYGALIEKLDRGVDNIRRMAEEYLRQRGETPPAPASDV